MRNAAWLVWTLVGLTLPDATAAPPLAATSPDGRITIELTLVESVPHYRVLFGKAQVVAPSPLGVEFADGTAIGGPSEVIAREVRAVSEDFIQVTGKRREVKHRAAELAVRLREVNAPKREWEIVLRASDDGVGFRYRFLKQAGEDTLAIAKERTAFRFAPESHATALPLNGYTTSYEKRYLATPARDLPTSSLLGLPLLLECPGGIWAGVTESNVREYAGLYLAPGGDGTFAARLSPLPREPAVAVRVPTPHASPWRVILLADRIGRLIESDLVLSLGDPCALADTSWIRTGKTTFPWWNGFHEENVPFVPGLNTATANHYIDFCAEAGIPYHSLDGRGNTAWYGGPCSSWKGADPTKAIDGLDLPAVLAHAKAKNVRLRLWMHWQAAEAHMARAIPLYRAWGVEGVMIDFMNRDDAEMNRFVRKLVSLAADNRLTVTLHGCPKPTGLERTYPNLLTHEGVMNLEYDKWDKAGIPPEHELTVPFTRMLAGPLDFHQGSFRTVTPEAFRPRDVAPNIIGTAARTLASYVVFQNHLPMVADYPTAYRGHPGLPVLAAVPTTWDDTRVVDAKLGESVIVARRSGREWWLGAMTDRTARTMKVPLAFLSPGRYTAEIVDDDAASRHGMTTRTENRTSADTLELKLAPAGGSIVRLKPLP